MALLEVLYSSASLLLQHLMPTEFRPSAELIRQTAGCKKLKLCPNLTCALLLQLCKFATSVIKTEKQDMLKKRNLIIS
ncbi:unnamed protein product [Lactuca virosa]|uniref:Uncharacterized protein n=1 Tax=Lactuca virosa TaxID=75947 RepID=A0AAU9NCJ3_9ASTR|nr:unnamed protein product [Lactuca virosa]